MVKNQVTHEVTYHSYQVIHAVTNQVTHHYYKVTYQVTHSY